MGVFEALTANQQKLALTLAVFILYFFVIVAFAIAYFRYFKATPSLFAFSANIAEGQRTNRLTDLEHSIKRLRNIENVLASVSKDLEGQPDKVLNPGKWEIETDGGKLRYMNVDNNSPHAPSITACMVIFTKDVEDFQSRHRWKCGDRFIRASFVTLDKLKTEIVEQRRLISSRCGRAMQLERSFKAGSPMIWTFTDFLYFSTVIQSTVGLGDIQPNGTKIRAIVILQIMIGYLILIVILNILLGWQWATK